MDVLQKDKLADLFRMNALELQLKAAGEEIKAAAGRVVGTSTQCPPRRHGVDTRFEPPFLELQDIQ